MGYYGECWRLKVKRDQRCGFIAAWLFVASIPSFRFDAVRLSAVSKQVQRHTCLLTAHLPTQRYLNMPGFY